MTASGAARESHAPHLGPYEAAFLAGGADRVVDTAVVALVRNGRLRLHSPGHLATADLARRDPVEAAVLDAVGPTGHRSIDTIRWRLMDDDRLLDVGRRLRRAGLLGRTDGLVRQVRGDHCAPFLTRAGRRALHGYRDELRADDDEAARVALQGREHMADQRLRAEIFDCPSTLLAPGRPGRRSRGIDHSDPHLAAYRTGGVASSAGAYAAFTQGIQGGGA
jgi:hypothetical protein